MNRFYDYSYIHIDDGDVILDNQILTPYEAVFRFTRSCDPTMKAGTKLRLCLTSAVNADINVDDKIICLIWHTFGSDWPEAEINEAIKGMEPLPKIDLYFTKSHYEAKCAIEGNKTHIFWKGNLMSQQSIIAKSAFAFKQMFPTAFDSSEWAPEFVEALKCVSRSKVDDAWDIIEPFYVGYKKEAWKVNLKNLFLNTYKDQIKSEEDRRAEDYRSIESYQNQISQLLRQIEERDIRIRGLLASNSTEQNYQEFVDYLKMIGAEIVDYTDDGRTFTVRFKGYVDNYDYDLACDNIPSGRSYLYYELPEDEQDNIRKLYEKVFVEQKYKMLVTSNIEITPRDYRYKFVNPNAGTAANIDGLEYLQNPHLRHHNCFGNNSNDIAQALRRYDYYSVAMYLNASNRNLSFGDSTVMREMGRDIIKNRKKKMFFCPKDGQYYSFDDIIAKEDEDNGADETAGSEAAE